MRTKSRVFFTGVFFFSVSAVAALPPSMPNPAIHFVSDRTTIVAEDQARLVDNVAWLKAHPQAVVILEGHCDQTGQSEYNMELGDRRAREVKSRLIAQGVLAERVIMVVSFGEDRPVDPGAGRDSLQKNRRVEFILR